MKYPLLAAALAVPMTASAALSDWYLSAGGLWIESDQNRFDYSSTVSNRDVDDEDFAPYIGVGYLLHEKFGLELEYNDYGFELPTGGDVDIDGFNVNLRYYFLGAREISPFLGMGVGRLDSDSPFGDGSDSHLDVSGGVNWPLNDRFGLRGELRYRFDSDDDSIPRSDDFEDWILSFGVTVALGARQPEPIAATPTPRPTPATPVPAARPAPPADSDGDGVPDNRDKCPDTPAGRIVDADGCEKEMLVELNDVHFDFDKATLKPEARRLLDEGAQALEEHRGVRIEIAGHTDAIGTESYNQGLSERRARAVHEYMVSQGIDADRMSWKGYGESRPIADNDTPEGRALNRRVELRILP